LLIKRMLHFTYHIVTASHTLYFVPSCVLSSILMVIKLSIRTLHTACCLTPLFLAIGIPISFAETNESPPPSTTPRFLGVSSCASSHCHGSAKPRSSTPVLQNEFFTWYKRDNHARAYRSLLTPEAIAMASHLGIGAPEKAHDCLQCHTTNAPKEMQGERFTVSDGVGCESCHGAAGNWIKSHVEKGTNHTRNVSQGLRDIVPPVARTSLCISCHAPTAENGLTHRLYGAGHPRVEFEIDSYESVMPRHWRQDDDYRERKSPANRVQAWLIGQVILAESFAHRQNQAHLNRDFSLYQCYSCHHDFSKKQFLWRNYHDKPGEPPLNDSPIYILSTALGRDPESIQKNLAHLKRELSSDPNITERPRNMLVALLKSLTKAENFSFQYCEQAIMGISVLINEMRDAGSELNLKAFEESLYREVQSADRANPERLKQTAKAALKKLGV